MIRAVMDAYRRALAKAACKVARLRHGEDGQGTTEYAILVGVLVVIAIIAITVFRPKLQELWVVSYYVTLLLMFPKILTFDFENALKSL